MEDKIFNKNQLASMGVFKKQKESNGGVTC